MNDERRRAGLRFVEAMIRHERAAAVRLRRTRRLLGRVVDRARCAGLRYAALAEVALRTRLRRSPTIRELRREAARLRQLRHRSRISDL